MFSVSETPCSSMPCLSNGTCAVNDSTFICSCSDGYYGARCEGYYLVDIKYLAINILMIHT